jgi:hypothetical protein
MGPLMHPAPLAADERIGWRLVARGIYLKLESRAKRAKQ